MNSNRNYTTLLAWLTLPFVVYCYFINWRTNFIYGDDINIYMKLSSLETFKDRVNMAMEYGKFRPVQGLVMQFLFDLFGKNMNLYYLFNITVQVVNTMILAQLLNLFLRSALLSIFCSLIVGLSRFSFFNITQLYNGGALEGIAVTFFLLCLYFIMKALKAEDLESSGKQKFIVLSVLCANTAMYTHERYIVLFPFLLLVVWLFPGLRSLGRKRNINISLAVIGSILLNVVIKKYVYNMSFFMGTSGNEITFSFTRVMSFFFEAVISIFQVNSGPAYLVGLPFTSLSGGNKLLVLLFLAVVVLILVLYVSRTKKMLGSGKKEVYDHLYILLLLGCLFGMFLLPAVMTIRLEQRWLQASLAVFVLMVVVAVQSIEFGNSYIRKGLLIVFVFLFLWTDGNYMSKGAENLYMMDSQRLVTMFHKAIQSGVIHSGTNTLYIWEQKRDENTENAINWDLGSGTYFDFYQGKAKKIVYVDSIYNKSYDSALSSFRNFDPSSDQIIYVGGKVVDITSDYLVDSLKTFRSRTMAELSDPGKVHYDQKHLVIQGDDLSLYSIAGIYDGPGGVRWADGNVTISMKATYMLADTAMVTIPVSGWNISRRIYPDVSLEVVNGRVYKPASKMAEGDKFIYTFEFYKPELLQAIHIVSDTIASGADHRPRSFPFVSCEIRQ